MEHLLLQAYSLSIKNLQIHDFGLSSSDCEISNKLLFFLQHNLRRLLHLIWQTVEADKPIAAFSFDAEKAFDRVEWGVLDSCLGGL